jgi:AcrR family transcriptional regulator
VTPRDSGGRANQRSRTRKDLLEAALRLSADGRKPTLEEVAEEARVSRATAYRYFPNVDAMLAEASLHVAFPDHKSIFGGSAEGDPVERLYRVDDAVDRMIASNEAPLRVMLASATCQVTDDPDVPARQNRRTPLIDAALAPVADQFEPRALEQLKRALALVIGTESMIAFKDVMRLDPAEARSVRRWMIRSLVEAAKAKF